MSIVEHLTFKGEKQKVSVIIPTKNCKDTISALLGSLQTLDYPNFEVILADSSNDGTDKTAFQATSNAKFNFKIVYTPNNLNFARNLGARASSGDYIVFTDGDCVVSSDWIRKIVFEFKKDPETGCVGGSVITNSRTFIGRYSSESLVPLFPRFEETNVITKNQLSKQPFVKTRYPVGCNMAFKREVFEQLGGFDENWKWAWDEFEFMHRLLQHGYIIRVNPKIVIYHSPCSSLVEMLRKAYGYGIGAGKYKRIYGVHKSENKFFNAVFGALNTWNHSIKVFRKTRKLSTLLYPFVDIAMGTIYNFGFAEGYFGDY
jgi:GT2 family glycosyltransferase